jgi:hypothetical protein
MVDGRPGNIIVMKKRTKKIFLPKWQRYFIIPLLVGIWLFTGYMEFFSAEAGEMGLTGFAFMTAILLGVSLMVWFMTSGRLPAYTMEEEIEEDEVSK